MTLFAKRRLLEPLIKILINTNISVLGFPATEFGGSGRRRPVILPRGPVSPRAHSNYVFEKLP